MTPQCVQPFADARARFLSAHHTLVGNYRKGGRDRHGSNVLAASGQPGELEHPSAYRAADAVTNRALASRLLAWTRKGEDKRRAQCKRSGLPAWIHRGE